MAAIPFTVSSAVTEFVEMSVTLTGFDAVELEGTGLVGPLYDELVATIGAREAGKLLAASGRVHDAFAPKGPDALDRAFRTEILEDDRFGPVARRVLKMWYLGTWTQLPRAWRDAYGATSLDTDRVLSGRAYTESLVWIAGHTHPMGAKAPGHGSWSVPPLDVGRVAAR
jgi:hypothetical protein